MRVSSLFVVVAFTLSLITSSLAAEAAPSCASTITFRGRQDPYSNWVINATTYQIYDIVVANRGSCPITRVSGLFVTSTPAFISESWNYNISTGMFSSFEDLLPVGQSFFGAGFVLANASGSAPTLGATMTMCSESCTGQTTSAPSTQTPSTQTPSTQTPSTQTPSTQTPSTQVPSTTSAPNSCSVSASLSKDASNWTDSQGRVNTVHRLTITNAGPCALRSYTVSFALGDAVLISLWNLQSTTGGYQVSGYGPTLAAGASNSASGFILANAPQNIVVNAYGSTCAC